jgi:TolB-like protein/DNA-binding winged helix-turn-helix (wHTH) protein/Tfp pilus assembly protein PilF
LDLISTPGAASMPQDKRVYEFGAFHIDAAERLLFRGDELIPLTPKVADTLLVLLSNAGRIVGKDELMKTIWPDAFVDEGGLARNISALRKALGDGVEGLQFIETLPKRGYRFVAPLKPEAAEPAGTVAAPAAGRPPLAIPRSAWVATALLAILAAATAYYLHRSASATQRFSSLIVLPLQNLSGDPTQDHIADTMTEELINTLTTIQSLRTISSTTALTYKGSKKSLPQIAGERDVGAVVEGSVRLSADQVQIEVRLYDARTEKPLWTGTYPGSLRDVLKLENEAARSIADEIRVKLTPAEKRQLASSRPVDSAAWLDYSHGRMSWNRRTPEGIAQAIKYFQASIDKYPGYARAQSGLADAWALQGSAGADAYPPRDVMPKAKDAALKAVQLDPSLAEGHTSLGYILLSYDWDLAGARRQFEQAIALNPGYATAHHWYAHYWLAMAQPTRAIDEIGKAQLLDPQSLVINAGVGWCLYHARQYGAAIEQYRTTLKIAPEFALGHALLGMAYEQNAAYSGAEVEFNKARDLQGSPTFALAGLGRAYALAGRRRDAQRVADQLEHPAPTRYVPSVYLAAVYAAMGEKDRAIRFTQRALEERSDYMIYLNTDPWAEPLRDDPRFREILRTVAQGRR